MAEIIKRTGFQNILQHPSLNTDTDGDGVVDGWVKNGSSKSMNDYFFDENSQMITISSASERSRCSVDQSLNVPEQLTFSLSVEGKVQVQSGNFHGRVYIAWHDELDEVISYTTAVEFQQEEFERISSENLFAPSGTVKARVLLEAEATDSDSTGSVWFRNAQLELGEESSGYDEEDFFEVEVVEEEWFRGVTDLVTGDMGYVSTPVAGGISGEAGMFLSYNVPENAKNITLRLQADTSKTDSSDFLYVSLNGSLLLSLEGGQSETTYTFAESDDRAISRGMQRVSLIHERSASTNGKSIWIDDVQISWDIEETPMTVEQPQKKIVQVLDFDGGEDDDYFEVIETVTGNEYGFHPTYRRSHSGFYSLGVEPANEYQTIPLNNSAGGKIRFKVPVTAIKPTLGFYALMDTSAVGGSGEITLNGSTVWNGETTYEWDPVQTELVPGSEYELGMTFHKIGSDHYGTNSLYIDDVVVAYDIPRKPAMLIATAPTSDINLRERTVTYTLGFESSNHNAFFTIQERENV
ncbi:hypothetical protein [Mechercharimyces sp. CAU 1602]|uniref:hypothetical protein n=1 Tax=Mechercharimyces sp. CAU 1602 TaxID=2973933 RepID=UPI0021611FE0|nr:hypothetical protein [Mechercharimyces sp. CAU 1602]MCS1351143.1 hypothetical protein [Mechercharimyces sp. CAU 1602]